MKNSEQDAWWTQTSFILRSTEWQPFCLSFSEYLKPPVSQVTFKPLCRVHILTEHLQPSRGPSLVQPAADVSIRRSLTRNSRYSHNVPPVLMPPLDLGFILNKIHHYNCLYRFPLQLQLNDSVLCLTHMPNNPHQFFIPLTLLSSSVVKKTNNKSIIPILDCKSQTKQTSQATNNYPWFCR